MAVPNSSNGVWGSGSSGYGVYGLSVSSHGVVGSSGSGFGVYGLTSTTNRPATVGHSRGDATGLLGFSGNFLDALPGTPERTGVYGYAAQGASSRGVSGRTTAGHGVNGVATSGHGLHGYAGTGTGVYADAGATGKAFHAQGRVTFSTAGLATLGSGTASKTVTPGVDLTSSSKILCTLMGNPGGSTVLRRVAANTITDTFTIYLTAAAINNVKVAWFVIG